MDAFDVTRAKVMLRDLERATRGRMPILRVEPPSSEWLAIRIIADRMGLLRLGVQLAESALTAQRRVVVDDDGRVGAGSMEGAFLEVCLVDAQPSGAGRARSIWRARRHRSALKLLSTALVLAIGVILAMVTLVILTGRPWAL